MTTRLYCVFDRVAEMCGPVVEAHNDGVAWRNFRNAMRESPNKADFQLLYVGEFDQVKGILIPARMPTVVESQSAMENDMQAADPLQLGIRKEA